MADEQYPTSHADEQGEHQPTAQDHLRAQVRKLVLMKETGPKSAAWHRARVQTIWRLQRQAAELEANKEQ